MNSPPSFNIDKVARDAILPVDAFIDEHRQNQVDKTQWQDSYVLTSMSLPDIVDIPTFHKKFKVQITVMDQSTQRPFSKTIFFGDGDDYVFTKNNMERLKKLHSLKQMRNALHADYWRAHICYAGPDWIENTLELAKSFLIQRAQLLLKLRPKKDFSQHIKKRQLTIKKKVDKNAAT